MGDALRSNESLRAWRQGLGLRALRINAIVDAAFGLSVIPFFLVSLELSHSWLGLLGSVLFLLSGVLKWWMGDASGNLPASTRALSSVYVAVGAIALELFFGVGTAIAAPIGLSLAAHAMTDPSAWPRRVLGFYLVAHLVEGLLHGQGVLPTRALYWNMHDTSLAAFLVGHMGVSVMYVGAFALGRYMQRENLKAQHELTDAVRLATLTDALLNEARAEIESARVAGSGRFSGVRLGRYVLGALLGRGGMGEIYDALGEGGQLAAVKVLRFGRGTLDARALARFERESRILSEVESPHLAKVLEVGDSSAEFPYIAMERLSGMDLETYLVRYGELPADELIEMATQVAAALTAAHSHGVIHRDLKPANIFRSVCPKGVHWRVLDFGVAGLRTNEPSLTDDQQVGTVGYMAPEQALEGGDVDERADVYGLAMVVLESATLFTPTLTDADRSLGGWSPDAQARMRRALDGMPAGVASVLRAALAQRREQRPPSCAAFASALARAMEESGEQELFGFEGTDPSGSLTVTHRRPSAP